MPSLLVLAVGGDRMVEAFGQVQDEHVDTFGCYERLVSHIKHPLEQKKHREHTHYNRISSFDLPYYQSNDCLFKQKTMQPARNFVIGKYG